jgi:MutS-like protein
VLGGLCGSALYVGIVRPSDLDNEGPHVISLGSESRRIYWRSLDPRLEYHTRLNARRKAVEQGEAAHARLAYVRIGLVFLFVLAGVASLSRGTSWWWLVPPAAAFVVVALVHDRVIRQKRQAENAVLFYERGLARIEDRWIGIGQSTEVFRDDAHLYAADLDLFGKGSLFELLCTARTRAGQETLARWLSEPASRMEILDRQEAVAELRPRLDLREELAVLGPDVVSARRRQSLVDWGTAPPVFARKWPQLLAVFLSLCLFAAVAALLRSNTAQATVFGFLGAVSAAAVFSWFSRDSVRRVLRDAEPARQRLDAIAGLLDRMDREQLTSRKLTALRSVFSGDSARPARAIARLDRLVDLCDLKKKVEGPAILLFLWLWQVIVAPFSYLFWYTHIAFAIESWRAVHGHAIADWLRVGGEFEAFCAIAGYAYEHPDDPFPEIVEEGPLFDGEDLRHPLIPAARSVPNSVCLGRDVQLLIVSGSNMSGKSTLLRTVGINTVLAHAGAPVRARRLRLSPLEIGATIRIQDSLQAGTSRFYTEIERLRRIVAHARDDAHLLFLLDELLHGTNSHDRALGATAIVRGLMRRGAIGLATTHDLALARIADDLAPHAANVHFRDELKDGRMIFDYKMHPGISTTSNALALMKAVGLEIE